MKKTLLALLLTGVMGVTAKAELIITGIVDGNMSGGLPKAIELYADGTIDLSLYTIQRSSNGAAWSTTFTLSGTYTNEFIYLSSNTANFTTVFGSSGDFANLISASIANGNGDDGFRIYKTSTPDTIIDQVWQQLATLTYSDSYLYRKDGTGPDGGWVSSNWIAPGNDFLDPYTTAAAVAEHVPFGTYTPTAVPEPHEYALAVTGLLFVVVAMRRRKAMNA